MIINFPSQQKTPNEHMLPNTQSLKCVGQFTFCKFIILWEDLNTFIESAYKLQNTHTEMWKIITVTHLVEE